MSTEVTTDIRCPTGSSLLMRLLNSGQDNIPLEFVGTQLMQLFCKDCTKEFRKIHGVDQIQRVLHVFTTAGEFKSTLIQFRDGADKEIDLPTQVALLKLNSQFHRPRG